MGKPAVCAHQPHSYRLLGGAVSGDSCVDLLFNADFLWGAVGSGQFHISDTDGDFYRVVSEMVSRPLCGSGRFGKESEGKMKKIIFALVGAMLLLNGCASDSAKTASDTMRTILRNDQDYYLIETEKQLTSIGEKYPLSGNYLLDRDITLTKEWKSLGSAKEPFTGIFDGNGYTIYNLTVTRRKANMSFFGAAEGAVIKDLVLEDAHILEDSRINLGSGFAIVGSAVDSEITECSVSQSK